MKESTYERIAAGQKHASTENLLLELKRLANSNVAFRKRQIGSWAVSLTEGEPVVDDDVSRDQPYTYTDYTFSVSRYIRADYEVNEYTYEMKSTLENATLPENIQKHVYGTYEEFGPVQAVSSVVASIDTQMRELAVEQSVEYQDEEGNYLAHVNSHLNTEQDDTYTARQILVINGMDDIEDDGSIDLSKTNHAESAPSAEFRFDAARLLEHSDEQLSIEDEAWLSNELSSRDAELRLAYFTLRTLKHTLRTQLSMNI